MRARGLESRDTSITTAAGTEYYTLPSDFLEARNIQRNASGKTVRLRYRTPEQMDYDYSSTTQGEPQVFTIIGTELQLRPIPQSAETIEIAYFGKLAALSDSNTTNWLTTNAPDLLLYGSLVEAEAYLVDDPRIPLWKRLFEDAMAVLNKQEAKGRHSGSALVVTTNTGNP